MNSNLKLLIKSVKKSLEIEPNNMMIGDLNEGWNEVNNFIHLSYLSEFNGGRCGSIDLWSMDKLSSNQYRLSALNQNEWLEIGQVLYEPLVLNKTSGEVYLMDEDVEKKKASFKDIEYFLSNYVFGQRYKEIIPEGEKDEWYIFLEKFNLIYMNPTLSFI